MKNFLVLIGLYSLTCMSIYLMTENNRLAFLGGGLVFFLVELPIWFKWRSAKLEKSALQMKAFSRESDDDIIFNGSEIEKPENTVRSIVKLFAIVMWRDNVVAASEVLLAHEYFDKRFKNSHCLSFFNKDNKEMRLLLKQCLKGKKLPSYKDCALDVLKAGFSYEVRFELLEYLFKTAHAYENICDAEVSRLREIAQFFVIKEWDILSLEYKYECRRRESADRKKETERIKNLSDSIMRQAYLTLGVTPDATDEEVKAAYHGIVKVCHPDKVSAKAGSKEWENLVVQFRHTVEAYRMVCEARNIS